LLLISKKVQKEIVVIIGGPGTGKSVVAINLLVELTKLQKLTQYVSKNAAPRAVYEARLTGSVRATEIRNMFRGSGAFIDSPANEYDALIVDEAHRLNKFSGLFGNLGENQIKEICKYWMLATRSTDVARDNRNPQ
jgi:DNA replication protein DnaC